MKINRFRVFDIGRGEYLDSPVALSSEGYILDHNDMIDPHNDNYIVEFFIGSPDIIGNYIYEGDIIEYKTGVWGEEFMITHVVNRGFKIDIESMIAPRVVGNIHNNPSLLCDEIEPPVK